MRIKNLSFVVAVLIAACSPTREQQITVLRGDIQRLELDIREIKAQAAKRAIDGQTEGLPAESLASITRAHAEVDNQLIAINRQAIERMQSRIEELRKSP